MYLIDTNILIHAFEGVEPYASFLKAEASKKNVVLSVITISEFIVGLEDDVKNQFEEFVGSVRVVDVNLSIAEVVGNYRRKSKKTSNIYLLDCLIAATAKINDFVLVSQNTKDYPMKDIKVKSLK